MSVPSDIRKLLADRDVKAHAALSCSFSGPIGETHFVVADGQLFVFERESLIGDFRTVDLDPAHRPKLERGSFSDTLFVALADGAVHELNVSSFERDSIEQVLLENAGTPEAEPAAAEQPSEFNVEAYFDTDDTPDQEPAKLAEIEIPEALEAPVPVRAFGSRQLEESRAQPSEAPTEKEEEDKQLGRAISVYDGSDPGCLGCLMQFLLFIGAIVGFWYLHIEAAQTLGIVPEGTVEDDSFSFISTKIVALIAGGYLGGRLAGLLGKVFRAMKWPGRVIFQHSTIQIIGPSSKWLMALDTARPMDVAVQTFCGADEVRDTNGKLQKRSFMFYLRIQQDHEICYLKATSVTPEAPAEFCGLPVKSLNDDLEGERTITFEYKILKHVTRRFAKML